MIVYVNMCEVYEIIGRRGGLEEVDRELEPLKPLADFNLRDSKPLPKLCTRRHPEALEITDLPKIYLTGRGLVSDLFGRVP